MAVTCYNCGASVAAAQGGIALTKLSILASWYDRQLATPFCEGVYATNKLAAD